MAMRLTANYHVIPRRGEAPTYPRVVSLALWAIHLLGISAKNWFLRDFDEIATVAVAPSQ